MSVNSRHLHLPGHPNIYLHWMDSREGRPGAWVGFRAWLHFPQPLPRACRKAHDPQEHTAGPYRWVECRRCGRHPTVPQRPSEPGDVRPPMPVPGEVLEAAIKHGNAEWRGDSGSLETQVALGPDATFKGLSLQWRIGSGGGVSLIAHGGRFLFLYVNLEGSSLGHRLTRRVEESNLNRASWGLSYYEDREWEVGIDGSRVRWNIGLPSSRWSVEMPKWRHGSVDFRDVVFGKQTNERQVVHTEEVELGLPEGTYKALVKVERTTWKRSRGRRHVSFGYDITPEPHIPEPGKGENSWDCGDDGTWGMSGPYCEGDLDSMEYRQVVARACGDLISSVLRTRVRHGGSMDWRPHGYHPIANPEGRRDGMVACLYCSGEPGGAALLCTCTSDCGSRESTEGARSCLRMPVVEAEPPGKLRCADGPLAGELLDASLFEESDTLAIAGIQTEDVRYRYDRRGGVLVHVPAEADA